jgi:hypothetical protein
MTNLKTKYKTVGVQEKKKTTDGKTAGWPDIYADSSICCAGYNCNIQKTIKKLSTFHLTSTLQYDKAGELSFVIIKCFVDIL